MSDKRKEKMERLIEKRDALRAKDFDKVEKLDGVKTRASSSMSAVYVDIALMLFCFFTIVGAPLGLFFAVTAIFKYSLVKKAEKERVSGNDEEPRA